MITFLEKYGFSLVLLYCLGALSPNLQGQVSLMDYDVASLQDSRGGSNLVKQVFWLFLFFFFNVRLIKSDILNIAKNEMGNVYIFCSILFLIVALSFFWSEGASYTLKRVIFQMIFMLTVCLSVAYAIVNRTLVENLKATIYVVLTLLFVTMLTGTGFASDFSFAGYTTNKNLLGINLLCLIVILCSVCRFENVEIHRFKLVLMMLCFFLLITKSKTCIALLVFYLFLFTLAKSKAGVITLMIYICALLVFVISPTVSYLLGEYWNISLHMHDESITGRGIIWDNLYHDVEYFDRILIGYGYGAYFSTSIIPHFFDVENSFLQLITSAHNGYLELILQVGTIGTMLIAIVAYMVMSSASNYYISAAMIIPIIHNITESSFFRDQNIVWVMFMALVTVTFFIKESKLKGSFNESSNHP